MKKKRRPDIVVRSKREERIDELTLLIVRGSEGREEKMERRKRRGNSDEKGQNTMLGLDRY